VPIVSVIREYVSPFDGSGMRALKVLPVALAFVATPGAQCAQQSANMERVEVVDKIVAQEQAEIESLRQYTPLVETYVQIRRPDKQAGVAPSGDKYFLGHAVLANGVELIPLAKDTKSKHNQLVGGVANIFSETFVPRGFLQMIYVDLNGFDRDHYEFSYIRREFLGEVRCLVFDVAPRVKSENGRFVGRIWVEDQDYHIVRFNGIYNGSSVFSHYFSFDSWRENAGKNQWLPAAIFCEEGNVLYSVARRQIFPAFRAQTRLWGYALTLVPKEQELSKVLIEAPVGDQTENANDYSPLEAERSWNLQAEDNVIERLEKLGLLAPVGEIDKILEVVINNLAVSNGLDIVPPIRCRVLMTTNFESYAMGHTIVLSRGLLDVLPDEATLAAILAHELAHIVLGHPMDTEFAFFNRLHVDEKDTYRRFGVSRPPAEERAANQKGSELLMKSPYKDQLNTAQCFFQALHSHAREIPNLVHPHLGNSVLTNWTVAKGASCAQPSTGQTANVTTEASVIALPLGSRIKVDPFDDQLHLLKFKPARPAAESEKMAFEVTPTILYLTRQYSALTQKAAEQPKSDP
jgi:Peptidase family M48